MAGLRFALFIALSAFYGSALANPQLPASIFEGEAYPCVTQDPSVSSCGPEPCLDPVGTLEPMVLPPTDGCVYPLPAPCVPPPVVISTKCACTKTVIKPKLYERVITAQKNQRFLKKTYVPVTEKIAFVARPSC